MKKHLYNIKNKASYFKKVVQNMDMDDIQKEEKHEKYDIHYEEFLDNHSYKIFNIKAESKYKGILHWIDLIQNERLHKAVECLSDEEKYLISLVFFEDRTQEEIADFYNVKQPAVYHTINKITRKIKNYMFKK